MPDWLIILGVVVGGYLLGSIPFGVILTRMAGAGDVRDIGSGNIGATNVLRTGRKGLAAGTLLLDAAKGAAAVCLARMINPDLAAIAGAAAFAGHLYPVWIGFKGGKGVATMLGVSLALAWQIGLFFALVWLGASLLTRISSVGGILAGVLTPIAAFALLGERAGIVLACLGALLVWKHRDNLSRLANGTEPRIGQRAA